MAKKKINIDEELEIIEQGRYGEDVRMAIHDALKKLNKTGTTNPNDMLVGPGLSYYRGCVGMVLPAGTPISLKSFIFTFSDVRVPWESVEDPASRYGGLSEIVFYDENDQILTFPAGTVTMSDTLDEPGYPAVNATDGNTNTDWRWWHNDAVRDLLKISLTFPADFEPVKFAYRTASSSNSADYDPTSFALGVYNEDNELIAHQIVTEYTPPTSRATLTTVWDIIPDT